MDYQQKRLATQTWFTFREDELTYRVRDNSGDVELDIPYTNLPHRKRTVFNRNMWLRNVGLIWCAVGVVSIGLALSGVRDVSGSGFWLVVGAACLGFYRLTWTEFSVLDTDQGSVFILQDKDHDEILNRLLSERKTHLLAWFQGLDFDHDTEREVQTIEWLAKHDVITKSEADAMITEIRKDDALLITGPEASSDKSRLH